jgi:hypothetical protein
MSHIRYAELFATKNLDNESVLEFTTRIMGSEVSLTSNDIIVISFDDGTKYDTAEYAYNSSISELEPVQASINYITHISSEDIIITNNNDSIPAETKIDQAEILDESTPAAATATPELQVEKCKIYFGHKVYPYEKVSHFIVSSNLFQFQLPDEHFGLFGTPTYNFKKMFLEYFKKKWGNDANRHSMTEVSKYNMIYKNFMKTRYHYEEKECFGIMKIKSNKLHPQFVVAYDERYFTKYNVMLLVDYLLKQKYNEYE